MIDPTAVHTHYVRLSGKGNIPQALVIGKNYELRTSGTITSKSESDNNNGAHTFYYRYEPVVIELITDKGESIKAKDTRSLSQLWRARAWKSWHKRPEGMTFEEFYEKLMTQMIQSADEIVEMFGPFDDRR